MKIHLGVLHILVGISVLYMSTGPLTVIVLPRVNTYPATFIIIITTMLGTEDGFTTNHGGGFIPAGTGGGYFVGMVDGIIGTRLNTYTDIVIKFEAIPLLNL